ncbi:MAG: hypothetical protein JXX29_11610 [Deltaproteobacteria bacterium]|nr:hypothetical protein [Deltaproteobacteria bacterium]MBN2672319.1 hypothetical protein [Deltaproteobacteria bacterium]
MEMQRLVLASAARVRYEMETGNSPGRLIERKKMAIRELTLEEFEATASSNMKQLKEDDDTCADVPLLEYVEQFIGKMQLQADVDDFEFHFAYLNDEKQLCHVGLHLGEDELYLVLVVDVARQTVMGHCVLDFSKAQI